MHQPIAHVATSGGHTCASAADGTTYCWGFNAEGELGNDTRVSVPYPVEVARGRFARLEAYSFLGFPEHAAGDPLWGSTCAVSLARKAHCWGYGGKVGMGGSGFFPSDSVPNQAIPQVVRAFMGEIYDYDVIAVGGLQACGIADIGDTWCWGTFANKQYDAPLYTDIDMAFRNTCAVSARTVLCWGDNRYGQVGFAPASGVTPVAAYRVPIAEPVTTVSVGDGHSCALTLDGAAYCWGRNDRGQLGVGEAAKLCADTAGNTMACSSAVHGPRQVVSERPFAAISVGTMHTCALTRQQQLYCWGSNANGQLGTGGHSDSAVPILVAPTQTFSRVSAGGRHTCAIGTERSVFCWGDNRWGQLGTGDYTSTRSPVRVSTFMND